MNEDLIQRFGFSEMYEWAEVPQQEYRLGRFVTFSSENPGKIAAISSYDQKVIGITTVNSLIDSDDPNEWKYKNMCNEYGDLYLKKERLAVGEKVYDQLSEMNYIQTRPWEHYITINNKFYNPEAKYVKRTNRGEWIRVNLMGKAVVEDNGECTPGSFCKPCASKVKAIQGIAVPATKDEQNTFYVLARLSPKTILVLNK